jgi:hypothetical protein
LRPLFSVDHHSIALWPISKNLNSNQEITIVNNSKLACFSLPSLLPAVELHRGRFQPCPQIEVGDSGKQLGLLSCDINYHFKKWRHGTQHNDTQHNAIQHNDTQHNDIQHNVNKMCHSA